MALPFYLAFLSGLFISKDPNADVCICNGLLYTFPKVLDAGRNVCVFSSWVPRYLRGSSISIDYSGFQDSSQEEVCIQSCCARGTRHFYPIRIYSDGGGCHAPISLNGCPQYMYHHQCLIWGGRALMSLHSTGPPVTAVHSTTIIFPLGVDSTSST